jgi:hypothetical protein
LLRSFVCGSSTALKPTSNFKSMSTSPIAGTPANKRRGNGSTNSRNRASGQSAKAATRKPPTNGVSVNFTWPETARIRSASLVVVQSRCPLSPKEKCSK